MAVTVLGDSLRKQFPPNNGKEEEHAKPRLERAVTTSPTVKPSFGKRLINAFIGPDIPNVGSFFIWECVVPALKYALLDSILMIFGEAPTYRRKAAAVNPSTGASKINYTSFSDDKPRPALQTPESRYSCSDLVYDRQSDAMTVLDLLVDRIVDYDAATVADVYDLSGISIDDPTMFNWGWRDLSSASVRRVRDGWSISFPKVQAIK